MGERNPVNLREIDVGVNVAIRSWREVFKENEKTAGRVKLRIPISFVFYF